MQGAPASASRHEAAAVEGVEEDRHAGGAEVDADLVVAAGVRVGLEERDDGSEDVPTRPERLGTTEPGVHRFCVA